MDAKLHNFEKTGKLWWQIIITILMDIDNGNITNMFAFSEFCFFAL